MSLSYRLVFTRIQAKTLNFAVDDPEVSLDDDHQDVLGDYDDIFSQVGVLFGSYNFEWNIAFHSGAGSGATKRG